MFQNPWYAGQPPGPAGPGDGGAAATGAAAADIEEKLEAGGGGITDETESSASQPRSTDPISEIQQQLKCGWTVHVTQDSRLFYCK